MSRAFVVGPPCALEVQGLEALDGGRPYVDMETHWLYRLSLGRAEVARVSPHLELNSRSGPNTAHSKNPYRLRSLFLLHNACTNTYTEELQQNAYHIIYSTTQHAPAPLALSTYVAQHLAHARKPGHTLHINTQTTWRKRWCCGVNKNSRGCPVPPRSGTATKSTLPPGNGLWHRGWKCPG